MAFVLSRMPRLRIEARLGRVGGQGFVHGVVGFVLSCLVRVLVDFLASLPCSPRVLVGAYGLAVGIGWLVRARLAHSERF